MDPSLFSSHVMDSLSNAIKELKNGNFQNAQQEAKRGGYLLCRRLHQSFSSIAFVPQLKGFPPLIIKAFACEDGNKPIDVLLEVPHPMFDHTLVEGLELFDQAKVKVLLLSGTHRCASAPASKCTGNADKPAIKTNCNARDYYTNADVAHSTNNPFHFLHVNLFETLFSKDIIIVSIHSTKQESFVLSDGTSQQTEESSYVARFATGLQKKFDGVHVETCNLIKGREVPNLKAEERDVCGATNVQGKLLDDD